MSHTPSPSARNEALTSPPPQPNNIARSLFSPLTAANKLVHAIDDLEARVLSRHAQAENQEPNGQLDEQLKFLESIEAGDMLECRSHCGKWELATVISVSSRAEPPLRVFVHYERLGSEFDRWVDVELDGEVAPLGAHCFDMGSVAVPTPERIRENRAAVEWQALLKVQQEAAEQQRHDADVAIARRLRQEEEDAAAARALEEEQDSADELDLSQPGLEDSPMRPRLQQVREANPGSWGANGFVFNPLGRADEEENDDDDNHHNHHHHHDADYIPSPHHVAARRRARHTPLLAGYRPRRRQPQAEWEIDDFSYEHLLSLENVKVGLEPSQLQALPRRQLTPEDIEFMQRAGNESKRSCTICLSEYELHDRVCTLPCMCMYHERCIDAWLKTSRDCPVDRTRVEV